MPRNLSRKKFNNIPLRDIHPIVRSHMMQHAARILNCSLSTLQRFLQKYSLNGAPLSYRKLKQLTVAQAEDAIQNYNTPLFFSDAVNNNEFTVANSSCNLLGFSRFREWTLSQLHEFILTKVNANPDIPYNDIAGEIGIASDVLNRCIGRYIFKNRLLDFNTLKELPIESGKNISNYFEPIKFQKNKLKNFSLAYIHQKIIHSKSKFGAAISLGVHQRTLCGYLANYRYQDKKLTYRKLKALTPQEAEQLWPDHYSISNCNNVEILPASPNATTTPFETPTHSDQQLIYNNPSLKMLTLFGQRPQINVGSMTIDLETIEGPLSLKK